MNIYLYMCMHVCMYMYVCIYILSYLYSYVYVFIHKAQSMQFPKEAEIVNLPPGLP